MPEVASLPPPPTLEEDLARLEAMNWFQASVIRIRRGTHPDPETEALLARRLDLPRDRFQGPIAIRYLSTLAWVVTFCSGSWVALWVVGTALGFTEFVWALSGSMTTLTAALLGLAVSQPIVFVDEKGLETAGLAELARLKAMAGLAQDVKNPSPGEAPAAPAAPAPGRPPEPPPAA